MVDHGNDAAVIQPGRAQNPDHAHDFPGRIGIGGGDDGGTRQGEQPVLRADENADPVAFARQFQQADQVPLALDVVKQGANTLQIGRAS